MTPELVNITTSEVAELARVSPSAVRRWVERGELKPSMKLPGGHYRFNRADVLALLNPSPVPSPLTRDDAGDSSSAAGERAA